ncbi:E4 SUMO-protein ligase PIAL2-like [Humulus lupulus]|uniref:E4 SUMO-protein ligase PIAL2-like n=1 Tax=Humulus lupulus TaxID=3486 RepID=UPI002B40AAD5|nr:E4 SUMO-protein ligase PIAL2-like [Humulus lupulus]
MTETAALALKAASAAAAVSFPILNSGVGIGTVDRRLPAAVVNAYRISSVMDRLAIVLRPGQRVDSAELFNLCLSLARGVDYAVANNAEATRSQDLSALAKQICERKGDSSLQAVIMVVMISVKNACKVGWFSEWETKELYTLANEIGMNFCSQGDLNTATSCLDSTAATVMARFYPQLKMGHILVSLDVKPGYGIYTMDFHILKNNVQSPEEKIRLFVAQVDNVETSACIITPQQVNLIVNGRGVDKRTNVYTDAGPQMPTNVTPLLKYGTNLLQAVGQFNGHYVIVVAFMKETKLCDNIPVLSDYVQPLADGFDSDLDLIEGPSRISLNCPISYTRISTPVKGHSCKHLQCFDFSNFININSRRPSWRCPHCNQHVCYSDIRLDQNMVKVLKDVGKDIADVIISTDGSWKAVMENADQSDKAHDTNLDCSKETTELQESTTPNDVPDILDLTGDDNDDDDDEMDINVCDLDDMKPSKADLSSLPDLSTMRNQNVGAQVEDTDWSALFDSPDLSTAAWSEALFGGVPQTTPATFVQAPQLADVSPVLTHEADGSVNTNLTASEMQNHFSSPNVLQLQQMQSANLNANEYGTFPTISRTVNRSPTAIQALPAQSQATHTPQQRLRNNLNSSTPNASAVASQSGLSPTAFNMVYSDLERRKHFSQSLINQPQASNVASPSSQPSLVTQNQNRQDRSFPGQLPNAYRLPTLSDFQNSHLQAAFNNGRIPQAMGQSSHAVRPPHLSRSPVPQQGATQLATPQASPVSGNQQARMPFAAQRAAHAARQYPLGQAQTSRQGLSLPPNTVRVSTGGDQMGTMGGDSPVDLASEHNWRPIARMRGSLSGQAYTSALNQFMMQPTQPPQPSQAATPPSVPATSPQMIPQLQVLLANSRNARTPQPYNHTN